MKRNTIFLFFLIAFSYSFCQGQTLEKIALEKVLSSKDSVLHIKDSTIYVNKQISQSPLLTYFSKRQWWHIQGILRVNCYDKYDSLKNIKFTKRKLILKISTKRVKLVNEKVLNDINGLKAYVYRRFYYCGNVYVLILLKDTFSDINRQILVTFGSDAKFITFDVNTYVN